MSTGKILITGATGHTGGHAIDELLRKGHQVRALLHGLDDRSKGLEDKGVEVVVGDYLDLDAMRAALRGVNRAYFVYPIHPGIIQATAYFAQAAREGGVEAIVNMSQISARENARSHAARDHWIAERVLDWSGIAVTHLRPTFFAEWLLYNASMIRAGTLASPLGSGKHAPVPAEDQARVIVGILENPTPHRGKVYPLFGPKEYTQVEVAQVLSRVLGKDISYKQVAAEDLPRWQLTGPFFLQHIGEVALDHQAGLFAGTNDLIETIGGRPPMSLQAFIKKHRNAFE
jgi:NAD(P)H dehydrogenase (quinone)